MCVCSTNLGVGYATDVGFSLGYVLCTIYVCTWYQPAEITSCEKHSMVVYIHEPYPGPERGRSTIDGGYELEAGSSGLYCLERAP